MPSSRTIALVRARGFGSLPDMLEAQAGEMAVLRTFESESVPLLVRSQPDTPIPLAAMMGLFSRAAHLLADRLFGLEVGVQMSYRAYGLWAEYGAQGETLADGVRRIILTSAAHLTGARLELAADRGRRIWRFVIPRYDVSGVQHADHLLPPMLSFARQYLGPKWQPERIEVSYARDADARLLEDRLQAPIHYGCPGTGIVLRPEELARRRAAPARPPGRMLSLRDVDADIALRDAPEPARALSAIVALRLLEGSSDIEGAARLAGISVQSLQRRLRQKGYTYREVVDAARRARAIGLLMESRRPLVEIALALGYEDQANFTRAFIRWFGQPPSAFRRAQYPLAEQLEGTQT